MGSCCSSDSCRFVDGFWNSEDLELCDFERMKVERQISGFVSSKSLSRSSFCPKESDFFLYGVRSQCPFSEISSSPLQVDGNYIDGTLTNYETIGYTSVLFYASWCPFSLHFRHTFEALSFIFPQIEHVLVEQSSTLPNVLSKYGIHSFPSILLVNGTSRVRYHGQKDILSLVRFYSRITGLKPIPYYSDRDLVTIESVGKPVIQRQHIEDEPLSYIPHLNLEIFGETRQLIGRILHMLDIRRAWAKLRLYKTKNFHKGARNARVWASSLASVSLGESSSSRST
ncbi:5'-adenylylsulfate reductase-like 5, partial [Cucurbita argyrosperma subsp. sororia]